MHHSIGCGPVGLTRAVFSLRALVICDIISHSRQLVMFALVPSQDGARRWVVKRAILVDAHKCSKEARLCFCVVVGEAARK